MYTQLVNKCVSALAQPLHQTALLASLNHIKRDIPWDDITNENSTFLMWSARIDELNEISYEILQQTRDLLRLDLDGNTVLSHAIDGQNVAFVKALLRAAEERGVSEQLLNSVSETGDYALAYAVKSHNVALVTYLLEGGAVILSNHHIINVLHQATAAPIDIFKALCRSLIDPHAYSPAKVDDILNKSLSYCRMHDANHNLWDLLLNADSPAANVASNDFLEAAMTVTLERGLPPPDVVFAVDRKAELRALFEKVTGYNHLGLLASLQARLK